MMWKPAIVVPEKKKQQARVRRWQDAITRAVAAIRKAFNIKPVD